MIVLAHADKAGRASIPPLTWDYWMWGATEPYQRTAIVACDQGHVGTASPRIHSIATDGTLTPSWVCPFEGCTWHEFARLEGWQA